MWSLFGSLDERAEKESLKALDEMGIPRTVLLQVKALPEAEWTWAHELAQEVKKALDAERTKKASYLNRQKKPDSLDELVNMSAALLETPLSYAEQIANAIWSKNFRDNRRDLRAYPC